MIPARARWLRALSPGVWIILTLALVSSVVVALLPVKRRKGSQLWTFLSPSVKHYQPVFDAWNRQHPDDPVTIKLLESSALQRRMLGGFFAGTPTALED